MHIMFQKLGKFVAVAWLGLLLAWGLGVGLLSWVAPPWQEVILDGEFAFLPESTPSRRGEELFKEAFPQQYYHSNLVLVLSRGASELLPQDMDFIQRELYPGLKKIAGSTTGKAKPVIGPIHASMQP